MESTVPLMHHDPSDLGSLIRIRITPKVIDESFGFLDVIFEEKLTFKNCTISGWQKRPAKTFMSSNILCKILDCLNLLRTKNVQ